MSEKTAAPQKVVVIDENRSITAQLNHVAQDQIIPGDQNVIIHADFRVIAEESPQGETTVVARLTGSVLEQDGGTRFEASNTVVLKNLGRTRRLEFLDPTEGHLAWTEVAGASRDPKQFGPGHPGRSEGIVKTFYVPVHGGDLQVALGQVRVRYLPR